MNNTTFTVAVVQDSTRMFDTSAALQSVEDWCRQASDAGASIVVFPEAYIGEYPKGVDFGLRLGMRLPEGRCFVMSACQFLTRADMAEDLAPILGDDLDTILIRGGSSIVSPLGEILAGPVYGERKMLTAEIDRARLAEARFDMDVVGHYARPDIFTLLSDETPRTARTIDANIVPSETEET